jgi:adenylate cyclase
MTNEQPSAPAGTEPDTTFKLRQAEMLLNVSKTLAAFDTLDEMLSALVDMVTREVQGERGTIFLNDEETGELYSRIAHGDFQQEIRIFNNTGIAGDVFTTGNGAIVPDAYQDERFNRSVDEMTGFVTRSILCAPITTARGEKIGVAQVLNRREGTFSQKDMALLEAMATQAAVVLQSTQFVELMKKARRKEMAFFDIVADITAEIDLAAILQKVMAEATRMLNAERSTLFLNDEKTGELFSKVGEGLGAAEIRLPNHVGIAGTVFTSGEAIRIPYAYADLRFNPEFDRKTGFFTRSILCVPIVNKLGQTIGVTQVLNKRGGTFNDEDEARLRAFTAQVSIALENAKLFDDIQNMKNYNEGILESMSNGVITLDEAGGIITCNAAAVRILKTTAEGLLGKTAEEVFSSAANAWLLEKLERVTEQQKTEISMDAEIDLGDMDASLDECISVNTTILPLISIENRKLGSMIMIEDISSEKRMRSTMARYMDPALADQLVEKGEEILGGKSMVATILFSDIRSFTTFSEELGPQATVSLLNAYFTRMVDCIQQEGGMLDKFIGDAIMAAFGMPVKGDNDEDRAVRAAIAMMQSLAEFNAERLAEGKKPIDIGIGLNTDHIVSGNIGSPKRMDYTLIGDGVNLASRLEGACKQYGAHVLISENTYRKLHGTYRIREIDSVIVKGKSHPVALYEVLDYHTPETFPNLMDAVNCFAEGRERYRQRQWQPAIKAFSAALQLNPADKLSEIYIQRCKVLRQEPPDKDWNGVWIMKHK